MHRHKYLSYLLLISLLAAATAACSLLTRGLNQGEGNGNLPGGSKQENEGDDKPGEGTKAGSFTDLTEGLEGLVSYRASFSITVDGKDDQGNPASGRLEMVHEVNRTSQQEHAVYTFEGVFSTESPAGNAGTFETYTVDQMTYNIFESGKNPGCTNYSAPDRSLPSSAIVSTADVLPGIDSPRLERRGETVNGIITDRYSFKRATFYFGSVEKTTGKYWLAVDGGYIVRLTAEAEGKGSLFGTSVDGKYELGYDLQDVNTDFEISLPAGCVSQEPASDIPLLEPSSDVIFLSGLISYTTSLSVQAVADFYRNEMTVNGWTAGEETPVRDLIILNFTKENRSTSITIVKEGSDPTSVLISESIE